MRFLKQHHKYFLASFFLLAAILVFPSHTLAAPKLDLGRYKKGSQYLVVAYNIRPGKSAAVRSLPSSSSPKLATLKSSDAVVVDQSKITPGVRTKWIPVLLPNQNTTGYVSTSIVRLKAVSYDSFKKGATPYAYDAICYGLKYLGTPYESGGNDLKKGICCSALVTKCFRKAGRYMPETYVINQYNECTFISRRQLKPGDLIFYRANTQPPYGGLVHVAIYMGNGLILNATGHTGSTYPNGGICIKTLSYGSHLASRAIYGRLS